MDSQDPTWERSGVRFAASPDFLLSLRSWEIKPTVPSSFCLHSVSVGQGTGMCAKSWPFYALTHPRKLNSQVPLGRRILYSVPALPIFPWTAQSSSSGGGGGILKSSRLPTIWLDLKSCVLPNTGLLQSSMLDLVGLGKLLGMNSGGSLLSEMKCCELAILQGVVFALAMT